MNTERSANWMNADRRDKEQRQTIDALTAALTVAAAKLAQAKRICSEQGWTHTGLLFGEGADLCNEALEKARGESGEHQES